MRHKPLFDSRLGMRPPMPRCWQPFMPPVFARRLGRRLPSVGHAGRPRRFRLPHDDGFVLARAAAGEAEILTLAVAPAARGKGLGRALLQAAIDQAQGPWARATIFLEVGADNPHALALYAGLGFAKVGMRKALL